MAKEKIYTKTLLCGNCNGLEIYYIPFETTVDKFRKENKCKNCGCNLKWK